MPGLSFPSVTGSWSGYVDDIRDALHSGLDKVQTPLQQIDDSNIEPDWPDNFASCPHPRLSCHNSSTVENLCCFESPGGTLLQTQFWDTHPVTGPEDSWTIHGLWPDNCGGGYDANCDHTRAYPDIAGILANVPDGPALLDFMHTHWPSISGPSESLWKHEWSKHGTCLSTLRPTCFPSYEPTLEVPPYFNRTVSLYRTLPTYGWLASANIHPSDTRTYSAAEIQAALSAKHGGKPVRLGCEHGDTLNGIWYYFNVRGSVATGDFEPAGPDSARSGCPADGIRYRPKASSPTHTKTSKTVGPTAVPTGKPWVGRGNLGVQVGGAREGCVISRGTWYVSGACATFRAQEAAGGDGVTLRSSKGECGVVSRKGEAGGVLECGGGVREANFFGVNGTKLVFEGSEVFGAEEWPSGTKQVQIGAGDQAEGRELELRIEWEAV